MRHLTRMQQLGRYSAAALAVALAAGCAASASSGAAHSRASGKASSAASASAAAGSAAADGSTTGCAVVHVIAARASTEQPGDGIIGSLVSLIQSSVKATVTQEAVVYPATLSNYASSVGQGDAAIEADLVKDAAQCPQEKFVLVGYSQGAQVVGDALGGGGDSPGLGPTTAPVSAAIAARVLAVIQMGDPRRVPGFSFDVGTDPGATGLFPRPASESLGAVAAKIQSYCDIGDPFCARGQDLAAHLDYTFKYNTAALTFVLGKLHAAGIR
jgi:acetylxylan esterase